MNAIRSFSLIVIATAFTGCAGYRELTTKGSNAFHEITLEVSDGAKRVSTIENLKIERKAQAGASFVVSGDITYGTSCRAALMIGVSFVNENGVILQNRRAPIQSYSANSKARFNTSAYINAKIGETQDIIDKVIITDVSCV